LIRISTNLRLQTWLPVHRKLSPFLQSRLSFKSGAVGALNSSGIISFKISGIEAENIIETLKEIVMASAVKKL